MTKNEFPLGEVEQLSATLDFIERSDSPLDPKTQALIEDVRSFVFYMEDPKYPKNPDLIEMVGRMKQRVMAILSSSPRKLYPVGQAA